MGQIDKGQAPESLTKKTKMSAPNAGRQSPEPERQSGAQQSDAQAKPNDQGAAPSDTHAQEASDEQKSKLSSNPTPVLEKFANEKTSKTQ
ncbi:hypothetical protein M8818_007660 [Zalaria obscura]|uniref:Uncharacterized protein n=1 Tax=Zalaria obscura TaxID=2024903 RepID=A0ACC3S2S5_9PEZI